MSTSDQTYKELAIPFFKEVFDIIDEVLVNRGVPYYLIGIAAIELQLLKESKRPSRGTKDIDFAIMISSIQMFEQIVKDLEEKGFAKAKAPWTLYHPEYNVAIDLLPFGEIEEKDTINFTKRNISLHVLGFKEVLEDPVSAKVEDRSINLPALPGMVILKLVAWSDRPEERQNDLADILLIIHHFYDIHLDEILETHYDIFVDEEDYDRWKIAARVLGRKASHWLRKSEALSTRIFKVLDENLDQEARTPISEEWARKKDWEITYAQSILNELRTGLTE